MHPHLVQLRAAAQSVTLLVKGKLLLDLHMKHHGEMVRMHSQREALATQLETKRTARERGVRRWEANTRKSVGAKGGRLRGDVVSGKNSP